MSRKNRATSPQIALSHLYVVFEFFKMGGELGVLMSGGAGVFQFPFGRRRGTRGVAGTLSPVALVGAT